jgi:hypothetical protein
VPTDLGKDAPRLRALNLSHLGDLGGDLDLGAELDALGLPREVGRGIVDQLVCVSAPTLLLNGFSAFSQVRRGWG